MTAIKKINNKKFRKCVDKEKPYILLVAMETSPATVRISIEISQKYLTVDLSYDPPLLLLGIYSKGSKSTYPSDTYPSTFAAALFTILNYRSNLNVQYRGTMKKLYSYTMNPFLVVKKQSDVVYKKRQLENILSELKHSQEDKASMLFHLWALHCFCWDILITPTETKLRDGLVEESRVVSQGRAGDSVGSWCAQYTLYTGMKMPSS